MGGGGILIVSDQRPGEPAEFIPFTTIVDPDAPAAAPAAAESAPAASQPHISLDENAPEVGPPEPFEVSSVQYALRLLCNLLMVHFLSTPLITTHSTKISCRTVFPNVGLLSFYSLCSGTAIGVSRVIVE